MQAVGSEAEQVSGEVCLARLSRIFEQRRATFYRVDEIGLGRAEERLDDRLGLVAR